GDLWVPGDISSAAFWLVGAAILPGSSVCLRRVGVNPTREGVLKVLAMAGADVQLTDRFDSMGEPIADIHLKGVPLSGDITITPDLVPELIDEIPVLTILGMFT